MNKFEFWMLSGKHKRNYLIHKGIILLALVAALLISWQTNRVELPTQITKMKASLGFILTSSIFVLAVLNRVGDLFKIKSFGFIVLAIMFSTLDLIIAPVVNTLWLMVIPLLVDDIVFRSIWNNIWYNEYANTVQIK